jgi:cytochrome c5
VLSVFKKIKTCLLISSIIVAGMSFTASAGAAEGQVIQVAQLSEGFNAEQKYMASCFACHSTGAAGAPKVGDGMAAEWEPRLEKGLDTIVQNAINGVNTMPAKGLCFDCSDDDIKAIVEYMIDSSS